MEALAKIDTKIVEKREKTDNTKKKVLKEAKRIAGIAPVTDETWNILLEKEHQRIEY